MVKEFPSFSKGYYRKAEILIEMKRYIEAELVLNEILKLEPDCQEAKFLLSEVQIMLLCGGGRYSVHDSIRALKLTNFNAEVSTVYFILVDGNVFSATPRGGTRRMSSKVTAGIANTVTVVAVTEQTRQSITQSGATHGGGRHVCAQCSGARVTYNAVSQRLVRGGSHVTRREW
ncbi:hypothetical protein J6590_091490 [Homalodisca vitripennis]|nr:hypothetical protein J6590_091490 [Homalodisca vitripennis]